MGQSVALASPRTHRREFTDQFCGTVMETPCGWIGYVGLHGAVHELKLGYEAADDVRAELGIGTRAAEEGDWHPELRAKLLAYASGQRVSFVSIRCALPPMTDFQKAVVDYVRRIPYGRVRTYGEVAAAVGFPGAARAVGSVMSSNCVPLIIPCHRVVAAGGRIGNYSCPRGGEMKRWLLDLEQAALPGRPH